jgi:hypothetical protein
LREDSNIPILWRILITIIAKRGYLMKLCLHLFIFTFLAIALSACGMTIEGVRYAWPVESVLEVGPTNAVEDGHHGLKFSVAKIAEEEFKDTSALKGKTMRDTTLFPAKASKMSMS